jgi:hypothetical protein
LRAFHKAVARPDGEPTGLPATNMPDAMVVSRDPDRSDRCQGLVPAVHVEGEHPHRLVETAIRVAPGVALWARAVGRPDDRQSRPPLAGLVEKII